MMADSQPARRFHRIRNDHASETAEDYVEAIADQISEAGSCRGADLARQFGVSHVTITKTIGRLQTEELVETEPYAPIRLTRKGLALATAAKRRHETVLAFLLALGVPTASAEIDAEGIEHHVSDETLRQFEAFLSEAKK